MVEAAPKAIGDGGTTSTPVENPDTKTKPKEGLDKPWKVIVYNDPVNLMNFVIFAFRKVFGYSDEKARQLMMEVHEKGKSIVWTGHREKAELYVQQLQSLQLLAALKRVA